LVASMRAAQPITAMCARGLALRAAAFRRLTASQTAPAPATPADIDVVRASPTREDG
jgi:hypothetical protein